MSGRIIEKTHDPGLLLFLGAGASADFGIPTTGALLDKFVQRYPKRSGILSRHSEILSRCGFSSDIEHHLALCKSLARPSEAMRLSGPFAAFLARRSRPLRCDTKARSLARRIETFLAQKCRLPDY